MSDTEFNLIDEKWIRVIDKNCEVSEVSIAELFKNAHNYSDLCGELPAQDTAVMRVMLAVLHTVFSRYDSDGTEAKLNDPDDALDRWQNLWESGKFPEKPIQDYLKSQHEKFWLFHPERPFFQTSNAKIGTEYSAAKLNGQISESSNKLRLFPITACEEKNILTFSEAARWLIYVNAFDDTSAKPSKDSKKKKIKLPSVGAGWLGKLGLITASGRNLFETLMLNLIMLNENREFYSDENPVWERDENPYRERIEIPMPENLSELYTLMSRRLFLKREGGCVTGFYLLGGDFFSKENAFIEPMTLWSKKDGKANKPAVYSPRRHNPSKQFWREFPMLVESEKGRCPGIITWLKILEDEEIIDDKYTLNMKIASVQYGDKDFFVANVFSDCLSWRGSLLRSINSEWITVIKSCIEFCDELAKYVWILAKKINLASNGNEENAKVFAEKVQDQFYYIVDKPFRKWLFSIDPDADDIDEKKSEWVLTSKKIAEKCSEDLISKIHSSNIFGKVSDNKGKNNSAAEAMNEFNKNLNIAVKKKI